MNYIDWQMLTDRVNVCEIHAKEGVLVQGRYFDSRSDDDVPVCRRHFILIKMDEGMPVMDVEWSFLHTGKAN